MIFQKKNLQKCIYPLFFIFLYNSEVLASILPDISARIPSKVSAENPWETSRKILQGSLQKFLRGFHQKFFHEHELINVSEDSSKHTSKILRISKILEFLHKFFQEIFQTLHKRQLLRFLQNFYFEDSPKHFYEG